MFIPDVRLNRMHNGPGSERTFKNRSQGGWFRIPEKCLLKCTYWYLSRTLNGCLAGIDVTAYLVFLMEGRDIIDVIIVGGEGIVILLY